MLLIPLLAALGLTGALTGALAITRAQRAGAAAPAPCPATTGTRSPES